MVEKRLVDAFESPQTETHDAKFYEPKFDPKEMPGTTHFSVIDKEGWAVAMTSTVNLLWGNWMVEPTVGFEGAEWTEAGS